MRNDSQKFAHGRKNSLNGESMTICSINLRAIVSSIQSRITRNAGASWCRQIIGSGCWGTPIERRLRDTSVSRTQSAYAHLNIAPAGFPQDERRRESDERACTGRRKKKKRKSKGPNLKKENIMSVLFGTDEEEEQVSPGE